MEKDWEFNHVGVSFRDKDKTVDYYQSTGIGVRMAWQFRPPTPGAPETRKPENITLTYGVPDPPQKKLDISNFIRNVPCIQIGTLQIEGGGIAKPGSGAPDYFQKEGVSHICFNVPDIQGESAALIGKGVEVPWAMTGNSLLIEDYLDLREFGNVILSFRPTANEMSKKWMTRIMANPLVSNWKFCGMGIPVRDIDKAVEYHQSFEIGIFQPEVIFDSSSITDYKVYGKTPDSVVKARTRMMTRVGPLAYQFIQPLEGESIYQEYLDRRGKEAGVSEFAFAVSDLEKETAKLVEKGVAVIISGKPENDSAFACFDTREHGGDIVIKLIQAEIEPVYSTSP